VVVDSIAFQFRQDHQDVGERTRLLANIGQRLMAVAGRNDVSVRLLHSCQHNRAPSLFADVRPRLMQVVITNHVTTRVMDGLGAFVIPSLGELGFTLASRCRKCGCLCLQASRPQSRPWTLAGDSWAQSATNRLMLRFDGKQRVAQLVKSPSNPDGTCAYAVTCSGIRDAAMVG